MSSDLQADQCRQCGAPIAEQPGDRVTCRHCGSSLLRNTGGAGGQAAAGLHLRLVSCVDPYAGGMEAFRLLIPAGWQFEGGVRWLMANPGMPAVIACRAFNPAGAQAFEVFPNLAFYWNNSPQSLAFFPIGSNYMGCEVRPPMPLLQALAQLVIPRFRGNQPGMRIVSQEPLPELAQALGAGGGAPGMRTDGGRLRVRYDTPGGAVEEEFYGVLEMAGQVMPGIFGVTEIISWSADYLFSFRAPAGELDGLSGTFQGIVRSFRLNPQFIALFMQISQNMINGQMLQIRNVAELSRHIAANNDAINAMIVSSYEQRQATMDRIADHFSQATRGVEAYDDPAKGYAVELPGGYRYAWCNSLGEYVVSDDASFNPNLGSNLNWQPMNRSR